MDKLAHRIFFTFILLSTLTFAAPLTDGLIVNLHLENNSIDSSGLGNDATLYGTTTNFVPSCVVGDCFYFDGATYGLIQNSTSLDPEQDLTISMWLRTTASFVTVLSRFNAPDYQGYHLALLDDGGNFYDYGFFGNGYAVVYALTAYNDNQWHHVVMTYNHQSIRIYFDGLLNATALGQTGNASTYQPVTIGINSDFSGNAYYGDMDELQMWNRSLSDDDVLALYQYEGAGNILNASPPSPPVLPQNASNTSTAFLPNSTAIGYPYAFNVTLLPASNKLVNCQLNAVNKYGTMTKAWNIDGSNFPMQTGTDGYLHSYVWIDDSFLIGETYAFTIYCGSFSQTQQVLIDVGGSSQYNLMGINFLQWATVRPDEAFLMIIGVLAVIAFAGWAYAAVTKRGGKLSG